MRKPHLGIIRSNIKWTLRTTEIIISDERNMDGDILLCYNVSPINTESNILLHNMSRIVTDFELYTSHC